MAIIARPAKQGGSTTYQGKVAAGYTKILASEVDADLNTIFDAFNDGVDAVNIRPNSITADKIVADQIGPRELADDLPGSILAVNAISSRELGPNSVDNDAMGDLAVNTAELANGAVTLAKCAADVMARLNGDLASSQLRLTSRAVLLTSATTLELTANGAGSINYDQTKPGWMIKQDYNFDRWQIWRRPANSATFAMVFQVDPAGGVYIPGLVDKKCTAGGIAANDLSYAAGYDGALTLNIQHFDSGAGVADPANSRLNLNGEWCSLNFHCNFDQGAGGFGAEMAIETFVNPSWIKRSHVYIPPNETTCNVAVQATGTYARARYTNAGNAQIVKTPIFTVVRHGRYT